jgi:hypothetical protein
VIDLFRLVLLLRGRLKEWRDEDESLTRVFSEDVMESVVVSEDVQEAGGLGYDMASISVRCGNEI